MPKNPTKIREQIAALEADLAQAERVQAEKKRKQIARAADRAGLLNIDIPAKTIEREFREIAQRYRSVSDGETGRIAANGPARADVGNVSDRGTDGFNSGDRY